MVNRIQDEDTATPRALPQTVIPAQAGIQKIVEKTLDSRLRGNDEGVDSILLYVAGSAVGLALVH